MAMRCPLLIALALALAAKAQASESDGLVLLVNRAEPASIELARMYCSLRGLPEDRICALDLPTTESITRRDYERALRDPLLDWLRRNGWIEQVKRDPRRVREHESAWSTVSSRLRMICSFYGVPVRIEDTTPWPIDKIRQWVDHAPYRDEAAVDSELALILHAPYDVRGRFANPYYGQLRWNTGSESGVFVVLATRLDGPDPTVVRRMMKEALEAETHGLHGRMYFDLRDDRTDIYAIGDFWLSEAAERFKREGYDCFVEPTARLFGRDFPMDQAVLYWGWYADRVTGPFVQTGFTFRPGAIAYHNHSGNAKVLRTRTEYWTGSLLALGAAASWGAVSEPFLLATPHMHIVADRLCRGATFAESTYLALPALSWQTTVVGDPLYRPFAVPHNEQIRRLEDSGRTDVEWAWLRRINLLAREGRLNIALAYARDRLRVRESALLHEKIAELLAINEMTEVAMPHFERAIELADRADTAIRIGVRYLTILRAHGKTEKAAEWEAALRARWSGSPFLTLLQHARTP
jgi:uncharacterized protein (TIGR03790 family)